MKLKLTIILSLFVLTLTHVSAQTCLFSESDNQEWTNPENWSCGFVPNESVDSIIIPINEQVILKSSIGIGGNTSFLVLGKIEGFQQTLAIQDEANVLFANSSTISNVSAITLSGDVTLKLESAQNMKINDLSLFGYSELIFNSGDRRLIVTGKLIVSNISTISGTGKLSYEPDNSTNGTNEFTVAGSIFNCNSPNHDVSSGLSVEFTEESCPVAVSNLIAADDFVCLSITDSVDIIVSRNDLLGDEVIRNVEINEVNITTLPRYGSIVKQLQNGNFKITYMADSSKREERPSTDTIAYEIISVSGDVGSAFIIVSFPETENLPELDVICEDNLPQSLFSLYDLPLPANPYNWLINGISSNGVTDSLTSLQLKQGQNNIEYREEDNEGCVRIFVDEVNHENPDPFFSLDTSAYCKNSTLALNALAPVTSNGKWKLDDLPIFDTENTTELSSTGIFKLLHTVVDSACGASFEREIVVEEGTEVGYDPLPDTICKFIRSVSLNTRIPTADISTFEWTVNGKNRIDVSPLSESSPINIAFTQDQVNCLSKGTQTVYLSEELEARDTVEVLSTETVYTGFFPSETTSILFDTFPGPSIVSRSIQDDTLSITVPVMNMADVFDVVDINGFTCGLSTPYVVYFEEPLVVEAGPDVSLFPNGTDSLRAPQLTYGTGTWSVNSSSTNLTLTNVNDANSTFMVTTPGTAEMKWVVETPGGQTGEDIMSILVDQNLSIRLPQAFSPNDDGFNDRYEIKNVDPSIRIELVVINRWGQILFSSPDYLNELPWDGTDEKGNALPSDTYMFNMTINDRKETLAVVLKR